MGHHGRPDDAEREVEHVRIGHELRRRRETPNDRAPIRVRHGDLREKTDRDHADQRHDHDLDPAKTLVLQVEDQEDVERRDEDAELERDAE